MERKAYETCLDPVLDSLERLLSYVYYYEHLKNPVEMMRLELRSLKVFLRGLAYWEDLEYDWHMLFAINSMMPKFSQLAREFEADFNALDPDQMMNWEAIIYELEEAFRQFKPRVKDICVRLLGGAFMCTSCPSNQNDFLEYARVTASFIDLVQQNLGDLQKSNLIAPVVKQHIALIHDKLEEFGSYVDPAITLSVTKVKRLYGLISRARTWFNRISCLTYLCLIVGNDDSLTSSMETMLFGLLYKTAPFSTSGVISSYSQPTMIPQLLARHHDFLLEDLAMPMTAELHEGLIFLLSFILQPDDSEDRELVCTQVYSIINEFPFLIHSIRMGEMKGKMYNVCISDFMLKIDRVKAKVKKLYVVTPYSSQLRSLGTNVIGFLNYIIRNLNEMIQEKMKLLPSLRQQGKLLQKELVSLKPIVSNIAELLENEHEEIRELGTFVICTVYNANYFIKLCDSQAFCLWYGIIGLPGVIENIKSIKIEIHKVFGVDNMYNKKQPGQDQMEETDASRSRGSTSEIERDYISFIDDERVVIDELIGGQKSLTIISILGSGGQGKTTFAKRIYNDPNVRYHFQKSVWCYISKDCPVKEILVQIIGGEGKDDGKEMELQDTVEEVWRSFKGRRYLIVMDDIWEIDAWHNLERSFPDDKNGSRILFTSRNHDLASQTKSNWISHPLPLFSDEQSWELMKKRVFGSNDFHDEFVDIGKKIASYCKGLPLAVVLIASVLRRTGQILKSWNEVATNLKTHLAEEGCGNVIELSYKCLPDNLKLCFQYFGVFPRGEIVRAKGLKLLWVGEGFISSKMKGQNPQK